ncbi:hypothetical protein ACSSNL_11160 [Thalassobius sp. S69A]|uniref:hypothetical protein n=1 Tax=unclassified Thalassovita TaxID=2619711 RepID=UPI003C798F27|tara:strand:- start:260 stop:421 length:162 start_codon:yes stop_codon:yes gene_type:complete
MFYQKIDPADAEKLMPEVLAEAAARGKTDKTDEPGVLRLLRELTQSNLFTAQD